MPIRPTFSPLKVQNICAENVWNTHKTGLKPQIVSGSAVIAVKIVKSKGKRKTSLNDQRGFCVFNTEKLFPFERQTLISRDNMH